MLIGGLLALPQNDLKKLLAYSTVSALGTLVMLLGLSTTLATKAAIVFLLVHSLYKASLFMMSGAVDHETGTRDVQSLCGLIKAMPLTAIAAGLAALSMSGFPPLLGFISKELLYEAKLQLSDSGNLLLVMGVLANMINVAVAVTVGIRPFFGKCRIDKGQRGEAPFSLWFAPLLLAGTGLILGLFPDLLTSTIVAPALNAVRAEQTEIKLKLWHGINPALILSVFTVLVGVLLYAARPLIQKNISALNRLKPFTPGNLYNQGLDLILRFAGFQTRVLQNGYLRYYLITIIFFGIFLLGYQLHITEFSNLIFPEVNLSLWETVLISIMMVAVLFILVTKSRLTSVITLGIIGFGMAVIFIRYGAPDLAITQILIETLTVILFVLVIYRLPKFKNYSTLPQRIRDAIISISAGLVMFLLILKAAAIQFHPSISDYFAKSSLSLAFGQNVVNVILVDFRALDTLAEISVLAIAAIGVVTLMSYYRRKGDRQ
jgi:multicomponent Na+:H+ antiporter subunit A